MVFFHNHLDLLSPDDTLIVTDKFAETLQAYKAVIEQQNPVCHILYIADAKLELPLKKQSVDCLIDFFASNEHNFYQEDLYLAQIAPYLKQQANIFGVYFFFQHGRKSLAKLRSDYPETSLSNFNVRWFRNELQKLTQLKETEVYGPSLDSGENRGLGFHVPGDQLYLESYRAKYVSV